MIITDLAGGLGNQLFQYAAGRALAEIHNVRLKISTQSFKDYDLHGYSLNHFNISADTASQEEIDEYQGVLIKIWDRLTLKPYYKRHHFFERSFNYDKNFWKATNDTLLSGYWQTEKYFKEIEGIIRKEFIIKSAQDERSKRLANDMANENAISLHIRRGDYAQDPRVNKVHGVCDLDYYYNCIKQITKEVTRPVFYIFSDDPDWAKENLKIKYPAIYVVHNGNERNFEDLRLMALCNHNIIANSTFSWWAAWLNGYADKKVFAPRKWFRDSPRNAADIIPTGWQMV